MEYSPLMPQTASQCINCTDAAPNRPRDVGMGLLAKVRPEGRHPWCGRALGTRAPPWPTLSPILYGVLYCSCGLGPWRLPMELSCVGFGLGLFSIYSVFPREPCKISGTPKLVEYVSVKPYSLSLVCVLYDSWQYKLCNKDRQP
jgi:hypothetical protein